MLLLPEKMTPHYILNFAKSFFLQSTFLYTPLFYRVLAKVRLNFKHFVRLDLLKPQLGVGNYIKLCFLSGLNLLFVFALICYPIALRVGENRGSSGPNKKIRILPKF